MQRPGAVVGKYVHQYEYDELKQTGHTGIKTLCVCTTGVDTGLFPGYKAPRLTPLLGSQAVAREVLKAIRKGKPRLYMPLIAKVIPAIARERRTYHPGPERGATDERFTGSLDRAPSN